MAAAARDRREKPRWGRAGPPQPPLPPPDAPAALPGPALGARRRPAPPRPRHVRTIFEAPPPPPEPPHRFGPAAAGAWCDLCCRFVLSQGLRCADCKYTCHAHCRDLVHLGCRRNGKVMDCLALHDTLDSSYNNGQKSEIGKLLRKSLGTPFFSKAPLSCLVAGNELGGPEAPARDREGVTHSADPCSGRAHSGRGAGKEPPPALTCCPGGRGRRCPGTRAAGRERSEGGSGAARAAAAAPPPPAPRTPRAGRGAAAAGPHAAAGTALSAARPQHDQQPPPPPMTWTSSMSSGYSSLEEEESEEFFFTARTSFFRRPPSKSRAAPQDVQKEREPHVYLSKEEVKEKIQSYNSSVTDKLKMTLNANGIYTGFIKVQMELCRPITVQSSQGQGGCAPSNKETAFYLPDGCVNTLHISSTNTVQEVIEALLKKFFVADNPAKFALYKRCHKEDQVYTCKLSDREHPLYLRLVAGPKTEVLSFVLREHETGEVMWEAFSIPELQNFLRILDKEENDQLQILKNRYAAYRGKLEEAVRGVLKPG